MTRFDVRKAAWSRRSLVTSAGRGSAAGGVNAVTVLAVCSGLAFVVYGALCLTSASMQADFIRFGLEPFRVLTGILEMLAGVGLLIGLKWPPALWLSSGGVALLMLCGVMVRVAVNDGLAVILPALVLMFVNSYILLASLGRRPEHARPGWRK